jgi:hypothetical protein
MALGSVGSCVIQVICRFTLVKPHLLTPYAGYSGMDRPRSIPGQDGSRLLIPTDNLMAR